MWNFITCMLKNISVIKSRSLRLAVHATCMGEMTNAHIILVRKHKVKRPLTTPNCKWEGKIRMNLTEILRRYVG